MNSEIQFPEFITPLMKKWLRQYKMEVIKDITTLGLFDWDFRPNRRKPEKPRSIPRLGESCNLIESEFKNSIYFLEIDVKTLHVFESSGYSLAGLRTAKEYSVEDDKFTEKGTLLRYTS